MAHLVSELFITPMEIKKNAIDRIQGFVKKEASGHCEIELIAIWRDSIKS